MIVIIRAAFAALLGFMCIQGSAFANISLIKTWRHVVSGDFDGDGSKDLYLQQDDGSGVFSFDGMQSQIDSPFCRKFTGNLSYVIAGHFRSADGPEDLFFFNREQGWNRIGTPDRSKSGDCAIEAMIMDPLDPKAINGRIVGSIKALDINHDGLDDILFFDAGGNPPRQVAVAKGGGVFTLVKVDNVERKPEDVGDKSCWTVAPQCRELTVLLHLVKGYFDDDLKLDDDPKPDWYGQNDEGVNQFSMDGGSVPDYFCHQAVNQLSYVVAGRFEEPGVDNLLFFNRDNGTNRIGRYETSTGCNQPVDGGMNVGDIAGFSRLVVADLDHDGYDDLLFYNTPANDSERLVKRAMNRGGSGFELLPP